MGRRFNTIMTLSQAKVSTNRLVCAVFFPRGTKPLPDQCRSIISNAPETFSWGQFEGIPQSSILLLKSGFDSFRIYIVKSLVIELFKILEGMTPNYLSEPIVKADTPYDTRDKIQINTTPKTNNYIRPTFVSVLQRTCLEYAPRKHESSIVIARV